MTMNRHIKHWFRGYTDEFPFCDDCRALPRHMEISDDTDETFPGETKNLVLLEALELPYTSDGKFMQCSVCGAYYWYRSFAPGGSEDAMETVVYETIEKTGLLGLYLELKEALKVSEEYYKEYENEDDRILYDMYLEKHQALEAEADKHLKAIDEMKDIFIKDTITSLNANASEKDNKYYREDLLPAEVMVAEVLISFLNKSPDPASYSSILKNLTQHSNREVASLIDNYMEQQ